MKIHTTLTVTQLLWLERCVRRLWLDGHGDPAARVDVNPAAQLRAASGQRHEHTTIGAMLGPTQPIEVRDWPEQVQITRNLMQQGISTIQQASLDIEIVPGVRLRGQIDALVRVEIPSSLGMWSYEPVEIKHHQEATRWDKLQLDLYRGMLGLLLDTVPAGELWLGTTDNAKPARRLRVSTPVDTSESLWQQLVEVLSAGEPPPIWFDRKHCSYCSWQRDCEQSAVAQGDLAILPNLHPTTARELRADGITSVHQIAAMHPRNLQLYSNVGKHGPRLHTAATAISQGKPVLLLRDQHSVQVQRGSSVAASNTGHLPIFLDLETSGYDPWAFGFAMSAEDLRIVLVAPPTMQQSQEQVIINGVLVEFVPTALAGWHKVMAAARQTDGPIIHWSKHEPKCLERTAERDVQQALADRLLDAYTLMSESVVLPIPRLISEPAAGVKAIGRYLGISREEGADDWSVAAETYRRWYQSFYPGKESADVNALTPIVAYIRADVLGLAQIWQWLNEQLGAV